MSKAAVPRRQSLATLGGPAIDAQRGRVTVTRWHEPCVRCRMSNLETAVVANLQREVERGAERGNP